MAGGGGEQVIEAPSSIKAPAGSIYVPAAQVKAALAFELLEPTSADGAVNWNVLDAIPDRRVLADRDKILPIYRVSASAKSKFRKPTQEPDQLGSQIHHEE
jgi:hypothetical protein